MPDPSQFNTDRTHPGRWTITFGNPPINMFVPETIVELGALMVDLEADPSVKVVSFQSANPDFFIAHLDVAKAAKQPEVCVHAEQLRRRVRFALINLHQLAQ
jgi:enoyl-CoA hydratase/carnithine racemase